MPDHALGTWLEPDSFDSCSVGNQPLGQKSSRNDQSATNLLGYPSQARCSGLPERRITCQAPPMSLALMRGLIYAVIFGCISASAASFNLGIQAFRPKDVRLDEDTFAARTAALNKQYLLSLKVDDLLWTFRNNAGLPAPGNPFISSWEDPGCEVRGQFLGHYLRATARLTGECSSMHYGTIAFTSLKRRLGTQMTKRLLGAAAPL